MFRILIVTLAVTSLSLYRLQAAPLPSIGNNVGVDDDDDTEVIEIDTNLLTSGDPHENDKIDLSAFGAALFGAPDHELTGKLVANYTQETSLVNPEELGSYLEGDILVPTKKGAADDDDDDDVTVKNGVTTESSRWPGGVIPFEIRGGFSARDRAIIEQAMEQYHTMTCIRFVPRTAQTDYISITNSNSGCWSSVGRVGGRQEVNLQSPGCLTKAGTAIHELMHAVGFLHEQNREERDNFVAIQYQNIQSSAASNFDKAASTVAFGVPYDYGSVMHYSANAFSTNGRPTIVALQPGGAERMGQRDGFSAFDVEKINQMYHCGFNGAMGMGGAQGMGVVPGMIGAPGMVNGPGMVGMPIGATGPMIPPPQPVGGAGNNVIGSFLGGFINGLGLGDSEKK